MALAHRVVAIYPTGSTDPDGTASQYGGNYSASYTSMSAMEAAENADLASGDGTVLHVEIISSDGSWNGAPDTTITTFDGWTTDKGGDGSYVEIKTYGTARSSNGLWDTTAYILKVNSATPNLNLDNDHNVGVAYLDIDFQGIQFEHHTTAGYNVRIRLDSSVKYIRFNKCYLKQGTASHNFVNNLNDETNLTIRIKNSILLGGTHGVYLNATVEACYLYNCTICEVTDDAVESNGCDLRPVNCAVFNNADDWRDAFPAGYPNYCASDDNDVGSNKIDISPEGTESDGWKKCFNGYATSDFRISSPETAGTDRLKHVGQNQTADSEVPSDDIAGTTRPAGANAVSVGAFEWVDISTTAAPTTLPPTTLAPTTLAPTTLPPTTLAPTTLAPTSLAPTTLAPTTLSPTTLAPTTLAPTTLAPTTLPPTTLAPTTLSPTTLAPTTLAPTTLPPTTLAPTTLAPTTLPPTTLPPTTLAPTTLAPTTLAPTTLPPTTLAPTTAAPTTLPSTTIPPTTAAPADIRSAQVLAQVEWQVSGLIKAAQVIAQVEWVEDISTTAAPTTLAPTTLAPTTVAPTTLAPTSLPPTTLPPTTLQPTTLAPTTLAPTTVGPTTIAPTTVPPTTGLPEEICVKDLRSVISKELFLRSVITKEIGFHGYLC